MLNANAFIFAFVFFLTCTLPHAHSYGAKVCDPSLQQEEFQKCLTNERSETSKQLDKIYRQLLKKLDTEGKVRLHLAMEFWTAYFWSQCDFESYKADSGENDTTQDSLCAIRLMNEYIEVLKYQLNCEEGDLSCVL